MARVLVVDDEEGVRSFLAEALQADGHEVTQAAGGAEAARRLNAHSFHLMITDLRMPGLDGMALLKQARAERPEMEVIVLTAYGTVGTAIEAMKLGAFDYLQKPISSPAEIRLLVARAAERQALLAMKDRSVREAESEPPLTYDDPAMTPVAEALRKVAQTNATVLLLGESGTGKEVAARAVHRWSERAGGPFVAINCAALSENLIESELFGHEKGAFTGAEARRRGRIELADGGTFFLDEVAELKPELQAKLLRVLEERRFERVGGNHSIESDVRWIAATNRDLSAAMAAGRLREDLYHRLAMFPVRLPALRERPRDIPPLARALLERIGRELGRPKLELTDEAVRALVQSEWPGNIRALANVLERAAILCDGNVIGVAHLGLQPTASRAERRDVRGVRPLADLEREAIEQALAATGGNRRMAADQLGIGLRTLYDKLKLYRIA